jgi:hypothetical protein
VWDSRELQGTILALKGLDRETAAQLRKATRQLSEPEWRTAMAQESTTLLENRVLVSTARVSVTNQSVTLKAGQLTKKLSGGARIVDLTPSVEFGSSPERRIKQHSRAGKQYTRKQGPVFRKRNRNGYVAYQAAATFIPRVAALWVQTVVRTFYEALER